MHLGHIHLKVSNLKRSIAFYTSLLNFKITEVIHNYAFLTLGKHHHDLALQERSHPHIPPENSLGLYHFALEVEKEKDLISLAKKLKQNQILYSPVDHGISKSIYLSDPDGNGIEVYCDTRKVNKQMLWHGRNR